MASLAETQTEDPTDLIERLARNATAAQRILAAMPSDAKAAALVQAKDFTKEEFAARRNALYDAIGNNAFALIHGAPDVDGFKKINNAK